MGVESARKFILSLPLVKQLGDCPVYLFASLWFLRINRRYTSRCRLSSSRVRRRFKSLRLYDRDLFPNVIMAAIGFSSLRPAYLLGSWDDLSGARVISFLALMVTNSFIRL